jgi:uncharacterized protein DUF6916
MIQRREFLIAVSAAIISAGLEPRFVAAADASTTSIALSKDQFLLALNSLFDVGGTLSLELVEVVDGPSVPEAEQFSLRFVGAGTPALSAGLYGVWHGTLGQFQLYLEPIGADAQQAQYRADFNLLRG